MNRESNDRYQEPVKRKRYLAPRLINYGAVRELTLSGTASMAENTGMIGQITYCQWWTGNKTCSERRVKENIVRIGDHPLGFGLYLFDYRPEYRPQWGQGRQFGVMIDEIERVMPEAVSMHPDGYKRVDHSLLGIYQHRH
jgi:hypothetical protein